MPNRKTKLNAYQYKDPRDSGMKKVKLFRKAHNEIFPKRKVKWAQRYEYYIDDNKVTMLRLTNFFGKAYVVGAAPLGIILYGAITYFKEASDVFNEKKKGAFVQETIFKGRNGTYEKFADKVGYQTEQHVTQEDIN